MLLHLAWYRCTTVDECRTDWDKYRIGHIVDMTNVYVDYPKRYGLVLNGTLTVKDVLPEDDCKLYICRGLIQHSGVVENITIVNITKGMKLRNSYVVRPRAVTSKRQDEALSPCCFKPQLNKTDFSSKTSPIVLEGMPPESPSMQAPASSMPKVWLRP